MQTVRLAHPLPRIGPLPRVLTASLRGGTNIDGGLAGNGRGSCDDPPGEAARPADAQVHRLRCVHVRSDPALGEPSARARRLPDVLWPGVRVRRQLRVVRPPVPLLRPGPSPLLHRAVPSSGGGHPDRAAQPTDGDPLRRLRHDVRRSAGGRGLLQPVVSPARLPTPPGRRCTRARLPLSRADATSGPEGREPRAPGDRVDRPPATGARGRGDVRQAPRQAGGRGAHDRAGPLAGRARRSGRAGLARPRLLRRSGGRGPRAQARGRPSSQPSAR